MKVLDKFNFHKMQKGIPFCFSSLGPKDHVSFCQGSASGVRRPLSVRRLSTINILILSSETTRPILYMDPMIIVRWGF